MKKTHVFDISSRKFKLIHSCNKKIRISKFCYIYRSPSADKPGKGKPSKKSPRSSKEKVVLGVVEKYILFLLTLKVSPYYEFYFEGYYIWSLIPPILMKSNQLKNSLVTSILWWWFKRVNQRDKKPKGKDFSEKSSKEGATSDPVSTKGAKVGERWSSQHK